MLMSNMRPHSDDFYKSTEELCNDKNHATPVIGIIGDGRRYLSTLIDALMSDDALNEDIKINI